MRPCRVLFAATAALALLIPAGCTAAPASGSKDPASQVVGARKGQAAKAKPACVLPPRPAVPAPPAKAPNSPTDAEANFGVPKGWVLPTFDDWNDDTSHARAIAAYLKLRGYTAVFPLIANDAKKGKSPCAALQPVVYDLYRDGFYVINHTWDHPGTRPPELKRLPLKDPGKDHDDRRNIHDEIAWGVYSTCMRPPQGSLNRTVREEAARQGQRICYWTYDSKDWSGLSAHRLVTDVHATLADPSRRYQLINGAVMLNHLLKASHIFDVPLKDVPNRAISDRSALGQILTLLEHAGLHICRLHPRPQSQWPIMPYPFPCG
jgi:peptidoglycan/xylan/chitin deacetylase (PgdA/CDA1 family)